MRTVVSLLALLPMLMPPGMCVCQFLPAERAHASLAPVSPALPPVPVHADARRDCSCDSCRERAATNVRDEAAGRRTPPAHDPPSRPGPVEHWPGCPAAIGAAPLTVALPSVTIHIHVDAPAPFTTPQVEPVSTHDRPLTRVMSPHASPPLFLSHCALLI